MNGSGLLYDSGSEEGGRRLKGGGECAGLAERWAVNCNEL